MPLTFTMSKKRPRISEEDLKKLSEKLNRKYGPRHLLLQPQEEEEGDGEEVEAQEAVDANGWPLCGYRNYTPTYARSPSDAPLLAMSGARIQRFVEDPFHHASLTEMNMLPSEDHTLVDTYYEPDEVAWIEKKYGVKRDRSTFLRKK